VRIVLDTSALINALRSSTGASAEIVRLAISGAVALLMDYKLICEYRDVALRPQHVMASGKSVAEIDAIIDGLESIATPVRVMIKHRPLSNDGNDDMVLDVAINGNAHVVVTNNMKDFAVASRFGIRVLTPKEFLIAFRREETDHADESEK
jgi:putative PIN family toxin of toxin-antitoxin system